MAVASETLTLHLTWFAGLREARGLGTETLQTRAATPRALYEELAQRHDFPLGPDQVRVAVNDEFAAWDRPLAEGDRLAFIPPVAGG